MLKCKKCFKVFSSNQRLEYHTVNNVCNKYLKKFCCLFCDRKYKTKFTFLQHLNRKHKKKIYNDLTNYVKSPSQNGQNPSQNGQNPSQNGPKSSQIGQIPSQMAKIPSQTPSQIILLNCKYCDKKFTRNDNLKRHIKSYCKNKDKYTNNSNIIINNSNIINNKNTINNINNITINNTINNFGKEKLENISDNDIFRCINMCYGGIPALFKLIHIDTQENQNLYLTSMKNPYIYIYNNNKWNLDELNKTLFYIQNENKGIIEEYIENNKEKFKKYKIKNINKMLKEQKKGTLDDKYNSKLKLLLINNKDILKKNYEKYK